MKNYNKLIIVGAGPIGLYFAAKCEKAKLDYLILESTDEIGGQLTHLYPEKLIVDIPGIESIKAKDYISLLSKEVNLKKIIFNASVENVIISDIIEIRTKNDTYFCEKLILATGLGSTMPIPLGIPGEDSCSNIIYNIKDYTYLTNKRVAIFGGGDSALDWARQLSEISDDIHLIHRRTEFRGNSATIANSKNLKTHLPFVPKKLEITDKKATKIVLQKVDSDETLSIDVDYIFVNFGNLPKQNKFPFEMLGSYIKVDENCMVSKNIFAIGDVAQYENKTRRILPGNLEADKVFKLITC